MPDDTDQPTRRTGRGTLLIVLLAAVIGAGLWYVLEQPGTGEPVGDATPAAGDSRTADSGTPRTTDSGTTPPADDVQTTDAGTTPPAGDVQTADAGSAPQAPGAQTADADTTPQADGVQTADAGSAPQADGVQTADAGSASQAPGVQTAGAGATPQAGDVQTADAGSAPSAGDVQTADAGATDPTGATRTADFDASATSASARTVETDAADPTGAAPSTDSGTASGGPRIASADPGTAPVEEAHVVAAAPEDTIEKTPVDAPPAAETTGETDLLAAVDRLIERVETAIQERLDTEPEVDSDTELRVQVTYDDSQEDEPKTDVAPDEATRTADSDAMLPAADAPAPDSDAADPTGATRTADFDASATSASARTVETDAADPTGAAPSTDSGTASGAPRIASADPGTAPVEEAHVVAAAPEDRIEKTPVDAPPAAETTGETALLATVDRLIERVETAIRERLDTEPEVDSDTDLRVQVTYDDSQEDEPKTDVAPPDEATRTADSDATLPAADAPAPDSDGAAPTDVAESPDSDGEAPTDVAGSPDSDGEAPTDVAESPKSDGAVAQDAADTAASDSAEAEAKKYVETLTNTAPQTISVDRADHFVTEERVISLVPEDTIENVSVEELARDETLSPDTPITVVREVEQIETAVPEQLIADSGGDLDKTLRFQVTYDDSQDEAEQEDSRPKVVDEDTVAVLTVREALERIRTEPDKPLTVIRTVRYFEVMTLKELLDSTRGDDAFLNVVTQPYRIASATLADLLQREKEKNPDSIFYLHTVQDTDDQGIWGIVHFGLIDNFARGMAIRLGEDVETYTVDIPRHADERLDDQSSSFLGKLIDRKTKNSYVYNYRENRMGRNPDRIYPGQELVIINFELEELKAIHKHFASS